MPAFNAERYIESAIRSVLNQDLEQFELIVVDDGSTDSTLELVQRLAEIDSRIVVISNKFSKGVSGALNTGLELAKGEYIARADADDLNRTYRLKLQYSFLQKNKKIMVVGGGYAPFNNLGHRVNAFHPQGSECLAWRFVTNTHLCHPTVMFRREVYEVIGGYVNVEAEDFEYFSRASRLFMMANINTILIDYRESLSNRSYSAAEKIHESVKNQAFKNFQYYIGSKSGFEEFYNYQVNGVISFGYYIKIQAINSIILYKISKNYKGLSLFSACSRFVMLMMVDLIRVLRK